MINLENIKKSCLVVDIETSAQYPDGEVINISTHFEDYVKYARVKWLGMYSYKFDEYTEVNILTTDKDVIKEYIEKHNILIGFNSEEFDIPIMYNNGLMPQKLLMQVDCLVTLGDRTFTRHDGLPFKARGQLMGYKFKSNSLKNIAIGMELETLKGDIDYMIFLKNIWNEEETQEIKKYLRGDVAATKQMFDKLWDFWLPFADYIDDASVKKLIWIKSSVASLTYTAACHTLGVEPTYGEKSNKPQEQMGGRVLQPKYEEARKVWYVDFASLYPHIYAMFNLFAELDNDGVNGCAELDRPIFHGNELFKVKGHYDISGQHPLSKDVADKIKTRIQLRKEDPKNPLIYMYKIFLNSLYGAQRSEIFEQIHTPNGGWDCCWLGQQINKYTEDRMKDFGFETIAGDTDSIFVVYKGTRQVLTQFGYEEENLVKHCLKTIVDEIKANVPFPCETFDIDIEQYIEYAMWPHDMQPIQGEDGKNLKNEKGRLIKKLQGKKKNYVYIYTKDNKPKLKIMGLPIKKDNSTVLAPRILKEVLEPLFLKNMSAKISEEEMNNIMHEYLNKPDAMKGFIREFKVKPDDSYKPNKDGTPSNNIYAQISRCYFGGQAGVIGLIKNKKIGNTGKTSKYCTWEEAIEECLRIEDVDLVKFKNELKPFIKNEVV